MVEEKDAAGGILKRFFYARVDAKLPGMSTQSANRQVCYLEFAQQIEQSTVAESTQSHTRSYTAISDIPSLAKVV